METPTTKAAMTAKQAAALVRRTVLVTGKDGKPATDKDGKPTGETKEVPVREDEVLSFRDYGDHVVVVTIDGQKFSSKK